MSILTDIFGTQGNGSFVIYTNAVTTNAPTASAAALQFTTLFDFSFRQAINIAFEPLENSLFSSDSLQLTPYVLSVTADYAPFITTPGMTNAQYRAQVNNTAIRQLKNYASNTTLLTILQTRPLIDYFQNIKLTLFEYELTNNNTNLRAHMTFQQIRLTSTTYGQLNQSQVTNPQNASPINTGNIAPTVPTLPKSSLSNLGARI